MDRRVHRCTCPLHQRIMRNPPVVISVNYQSKHRRNKIHQGSRQGTEEGKRAEDEGRSCSRFLFSFTCLISCLSQIWWMSSPSTGGYFAYDVVTRVEIAYDEVIKYPTKTFCFYTVDIVDWESLSANEELWSAVRERMTENSVNTGHSGGNSDNPDGNSDNPGGKSDNPGGNSDAGGEKGLSLDSLMDQQGYDHDYKLTLDMILKQLFNARDLLNYTHRHDSIFLDCSIVRNTNYTLFNSSCMDIYWINKFMLKSYTCFELYPKENREYKLTSTHLIYGYDSGVLSTIRLKKPFCDRVKQSMIYIHDPMELPSAKNTLYALVFELNQIINLSFLKLISTLLPEPYPTACRNYSAEGIGSQVNCINGCTARKTMLFKYNTDLTPITQRPIRAEEGGDEYLGLRVFSDKQLLRNVTLFNISREISQYCHTLCHRKDCDDVNIAPVLLSTSKYLHNLYLFHMSHEPGVTTRAVEKTVITNFLSDLASTLGFWLGFSLSHTLGAATRVLKTIRSQK